MSNITRPRHMRAERTRAHEQNYPRMHNLEVNTLGNAACKRRKTGPNLRDCFSNAIKAYIPELVEQVLFRESRLPDLLIQDGCLTEDECRNVRDRTERKDQMRIVVAIVRGRDLKIMENFVKRIAEDNRTLGIKINECLEENMKAGFRDKRCVRCKMKLQVNIKYVADELYSRDHLSDRLYTEIIHDERPMGAQDALWDSLIKEVEGNRCALDRLQQSLSVKHHYEHLAGEIARFLTRDNTLMECACHVFLRPASIRSVSSTDSNEPQSSYSRESDMSVELNSNLFDHPPPRPNAMYFPSEECEPPEIRTEPRSGTTVARL